MIELRCDHTADLDGATRAAVRALLDAAFDQDFSDHDWDHTLGGMHVSAWEDGELVGHGALVQRRLLHGGRALRTGYVEGMAVRADRRRRGHAAAIMELLERLIRGGYEVGALSATEQSAGLYAARGWRRWQGADLGAVSCRSHSHRGGRRRLCAAAGGAAGPDRPAHLRLARRRRLVSRRRPGHTPRQPIIGWMVE